MDKEPKNEILYPKLREEILKMMKQDQIVVTGIYDESVIKRNTKRIKDIISQFGWPSISLIGTDGSHAAWLLVQHSDYDIPFQKEALKLLQIAVEKGEASKKNLAYLIDRVKVNSGELRLFGTQFKDNKPLPIENEEQLEERRKEYELEPFEEYRKQMEAREKHNAVL